MSWAEIKKALNSTLGTDKFISLDQLIKGGQQTFTSNGTFVVPKGIEFIKVTACGGGAGGNGGSTEGSSFSGGGGGGGAAAVADYLIKVTSGQSIAITIGQGGTGASAEKQTGANGTATIIGSYLTLPGGLAGTSWQLGGEAGGSGGGNGGDGGSTSNIAEKGEDGIRGRGGSVYPTVAENTSQLGGGGGGSLGDGGDYGGSTYGSNSGSGGGGGGGAFNGGNGGNGICIIRWGALV